MWLQRAIGYRRNTIQIYNEWQTYCAADTFNRRTIEVVAGGDHSFAVHENCLVYALDLDYFAQRGAIEQKREDYNNILRPGPVESLEGRAKVGCLAYQETGVDDNWRPGACISACFGPGLGRLTGIGPQSMNQRIFKYWTGGDRAARCCLMT